MLQITSLYAAIFAILIIFLAYKVVNFRRTKQVGLGDNGDESGILAIRAHANAVEYIPMIVILMALFESGDGNSMLLHGIGIIAVFARVIHAFGLSSSAGKSMGRFYGTLFTWVITLVLAGLNIYQFAF